MVDEKTIDVDDEDEYYNTETKNRLDIISRNIIDKYKQLPDTKNRRHFMRIFLSGATECEYDKQGRINIPPVLVKYATLKRECVIIGVNDRLEIWDKERWDNFISENEECMSEIADKLSATNLEI